MVGVNRLLKIIPHVGTSVSKVSVSIEANWSICDLITVQRTYTEHCRRWNLVFVSLLSLFPL